MERKAMYKVTAFLKFFQGKNQDYSSFGGLIQLQ